MEILYLLIPLAVVLMAVAIWFFMWTVKSGQYEDMDGPAHRILMDDDDPLIPENARIKKPKPAVKSTDTDAKAAPESNQ